MYSIIAIIAPSINGLPHPSVILTPMNKKEHNQIVSVIKSMEKFYDDIHYNESQESLDIAKDSETVNQTHIRLRGRPLKNYDLLKVDYTEDSVYAIKIIKE